MTSIVKYLNSALIYFNQTFFRMPLYLWLTWGKLFETMVDGSAVYVAGKAALQSAISEYDQAVLDLVAAVISG